MNVHELAYSSDSEEERRDELKQRRSQRRYEEALKRHISLMEKNHVDGRKRRQRHWKGEGQAPSYGKIDAIAEVVCGFLSKHRYLTHKSWDFQSWSMWQGVVLMVLLSVLARVWEGSLSLSDLPLGYG
jgi:hypothetical protein